MWAEFFSIPSSELLKILYTKMSSQGEGIIKSWIIVVIVISCLSVVGMGIGIYFVYKYFMKHGLPQINFNSNLAATTNTPFATIPNSDIENATVENFLNEIAREKPIRFTRQQLVGFTRNYATRLGSGGFGVVYKGEFSNGIAVAVKVLNGDLDYKSVERQFMAEMGTIGRTFHANLVRIYGFCFDSVVRALVYEYMDKGSLDTYLFNKNHAIPWEKLHEIAIGTARGLTYLHDECEQRIIHYDIKPANILLDQNFSPKVADFGLAKLCSRENTHVSMTMGRGTPGYAAPEMWMMGQVTYKCDVYSYGMLLFEIVGRRKNFDESLEEDEHWFPKWVWERYENREMERVMVKSGVEDEQKGEAERMLMVALWCVQYQPERRPPMSKVVKMLEGEIDIVPPLNPFQHLYSSSVPSLDPWSDMSSSSGAATKELRFYSLPIEKPRNNDPQTHSIVTVI